MEFIENLEFSDFESSSEAYRVLLNIAMKNELKATVVWVRYDDRWTVYQRFFFNFLERFHVSLESNENVEVAFFQMHDHTVVVLEVSHAKPTANGPLII